MTGRALIALVGATLRKGSGRRMRVEVAPRYSAWAKNHQDVLREAFQVPNREIDLLEGRSARDLRALGFEPLCLDAEDRFLVGPSPARWSHPLGDEAGDRLLLMPIDEALVLSRERKEQLHHEVRMMSDAIHFQDLERSRP